MLRAILREDSALDAVPETEECIAQLVFLMREKKIHGLPNSPGNSPSTPGKTLSLSQIATKGEISAVGERCNVFTTAVWFKQHRNLECELYYLALLGLERGSNVKGYR